MLKYKKISTAHPMSPVHLYCLLLIPDKLLVCLLDERRCGRKNWPIILNNTFLYSQQYIPLFDREHILCQGQISTKSDSNLDFQINPKPDLMSARSLWILKMSWIHYLVGRHQSFRTVSWKSTS